MDARLLPIVLPTAKKLFQLSEAVKSVYKAESIQNKTRSHKRYIDRLKAQIKILEQEIEKDTSEIKNP
jgi:peptidoglycan hydrolase CwlO-like protein